MASSSHSAREKPPVPLVSVSLSVPQQRQECAAWLQKQKPDVVASVMEMAQSVYAFVKNAGKDVAHVDLVKLHQSQVSDLKEQISMYDMEMQRVKSAHSLELQHAASTLSTEYESKLDLAVRQAHASKQKDVSDAMEKVTQLSAHVRQYELEREGVNATHKLEINNTVTRVRAECNAELQAAMRSDSDAESRKFEETLSNLSLSSAAPTFCCLAQPPRRCFSTRLSVVTCWSHVGRPAGRDPESDGEHCTRGVPRVRVLHNHAREPPLQKHAPDRDSETKPRIPDRQGHFQ